MRRLVLVAPLVAAGLVGCGGDRAVEADFTTARGLTEGADVRIAGAVAGRVDRIRLTGAGHARVRLRLDEDAPTPGADAVAAIRPGDLLGDVHLELSPGRDRRPLAGPVPVARTSNAPRLDELLGTFQQPVRTGLQVLLAETGRALGGRGDDLARAAVELRPALEATDAVLRELDDQEAALESLVTDAERAATGLARRPAAVGRLVRGLDAAATAAASRDRELDRGLRDAPATLTRVRSTATGLERTALAATPLAAELRGSAAPLAGALAEARPFLRALDRANGPLGGTVRALGAALRDAEPALGSLDGGLRALDAIGGDLDALSAAVEPAARPISEGFFVNFADQGAEPGRQPGDPFADPRRGYWRGAAILSCEAFGVKVEPGCLTRVLAPAPRRRRAPSSDRDARPPTPVPSRPAAPAAAAPAPDVVPAPLRERLPDPVGRALDGVGSAAGGLLDFLLRP